MGRQGSGRFAAIGVLVILAVCGVFPVAAEAAAGERITTYLVDFDIQADGAVQVTERIGYDFGSTQRHGITRDIPTRESADATHDRVYRVEDVRVTSPTGAPADVLVQDNARTAFLRIGDPNTTVSGPQTYEISYRLVGALNAQEKLDELYWDAVGDGWDVPVARATVVVDAPDGIEKITCFSDSTGGTAACDKATRDTPRTARFSHSDLDPGQALTVVVGLRKGVVTVPPPELVDSGPRPDRPEPSDEVDTSRRPGPMSYAVAGFAVLGSLAVAGVGYWRRGRDQRYLALPPGMLPAGGEAPAGADGRSAAGPIGFGRQPAIAPEFQPPDGIAPGLAGTLLDERADTLDVSATIVDLAVRRHLHIEELPPAHFWNNRDWRLTRLAPPPGDPLSPAEEALVGALFDASGSQVLLSDLKYHFASKLTTVKGLMYDEVVRRGWFHKRPDKTRRIWEVAGMVVTVGGAFLVFSSFSDSRFNLVLIGVAVAVGGLVLRKAGSAMPARTPAGTAMLARVQGFRRYLETAEAEQLRFEEGADIFGRYLAYAMVFDVTERWARVFATLAVTQSAAAGVYWYTGPHGFDASHLGSSLTNFADSTSSTLSATRSSSSSGGSGFSGGSSGGGGGGGGGGSW